MERNILYSSFILSSPSIFEMLLCYSLSTLTLVRASRFYILYILLLPKCKFTMLGTFSKLVRWVISFSYSEIIVTLEKFNCYPVFIFMLVPFAKRPSEIYFFGYSLIWWLDLMLFIDAIYFCLFSSLRDYYSFKASARRY